MQPAKIHKKPVFCRQKLISQKWIKKFQHFFDIPKEETFMFIILKNQRCIYILSVLFCGKTYARYTLCERYTLCAGRPSLVANLGLPDDFSQNMLPKTPTWNGNVGWGTRALLESSFNVGKNSLPAHSAAGEILWKQKN
jgi:hypothetical protein